MVLSLGTDSDRVLDGLLTNVNRQRQTVGFNLAFNNLQNTVIGRMNKKIAEIANVEENQREINSLSKTYNDLAARRKTVADFAFTNQANRERLTDVSKLATQAVFNFSLGDTDSSNVSAAEVKTLNAARDKIRAASDRLVELSHPEFIDGNNVTKVRSLVDSLFELTPIEGPLDDKGSGSPSNDNRAILDLLSRLALVSGAASDASLTLHSSSSKLVKEIDTKLIRTNTEIKTINAVRAAKIEYDIQMLRTKNATFLRSIEIAFDANSQGANGLAAAIASRNEDPPLGSVLSILT